MAKVKKVKTVSTQELDNTRVYPSSIGGPPPSAKMPESQVSNPSLGSEYPYKQDAPQEPDELPGNASGTPGTRVYAGIIKEEWRQTLSNYISSYDEYNKMRYEHGAAQALLQYVKLPLLQAQYDIVPASEDPIHKEHAELAKFNFFNDISFPWNEYMREAYTYLDFGYSVCEPIWKEQDWSYKTDSGATKTIKGAAMYKKLAFRSQRTIWKWLFTLENKFNGVHQLALDPHGRCVSVDLTVPNVLVFTHQKEGDNYMGWALCRSMYPHWKRIEEIYWVEIIGLIKNAIGFPYMQEELLDQYNTKGATPEDFVDAENFVRNIQAAEVMSGAIGRRWKLAELEGKINTEAIHNSIVHHLTMMALSVLADFSLLGTVANKGAYNVADIKQSFFLMAEKDRANPFVDTMNSYAIPRLIDANYTVTDGRYPKLKMLRISEENLEAWAKNLLTLVQAGAVTLDRPMEEHARSMYEYPEIDEATQKVAPTQPPRQQPQQQPATSMPTGKLSLSEKPGAKKHLHEVIDKNDQVETRFIRAQSPVYEKWQKDLSKQVSEGKRPRELRVPDALVKEYAENLDEAFFKAEINGGENVQKQLNKTVEPKKWKTLAREKAEDAALLLAEKDAMDLRYFTGMEMIKRVGRKKEATIR